MRSDVPVGSFLSGGIDSSIIASIAREMNPNLLTFSVGFEQRGFSEVDVAKETAEKLGVKTITYSFLQKSLWMSSQKSFGTWMIL